ncbi:hypothetical protein KBY96_14180 [Cyanobium sp. ATX 6A2]|jgi:hypothetical protein|uniref:hypothetical protein n=1 Tax=Cyanobium sp. ATX 6A2 TaxID=2823700 RepID=UPI0020CC4B0F|nr:hypothetical protein [Cyanobium sp. ATX 6A2]MCP9889071.1 hypothetical protein [Cyanobium sp. ATX 6A2]
MPNAQKGRGDRAEREAAELLTLLLGLPIRRKLGAGRSDDVGDLDGLSDFVLQVADWKDAARAVREKPEGAEQQRLNAQAPHAATLVRFRGGCWRVALTPEQWARLVLELRAPAAARPAAPAALVHLSEPADRLAA